MTYLLLASLSPSVSFAQLTQFSSDYLAFEAEDFFSAVNEQEDRGWIAVDANTELVTEFGTSVLPAWTNAGGGSAVFDQQGNAPDYLQYRLEFLTPGDYHLYLRHSPFERGNNVDNYFGENSIYVSSVLGRDGLEGTEADPRGSRDAPAPSLYLSVDVFGAIPGEDRFEGRFEWWNAEADESDTDFNSNAVYSVESEAIFDWGLASRETHMAIDRIVFHKNGNLSSSELDRLISSQDGIAVPADFNGNSVIDFGDFLVLADNFNESFPLDISFERGDQNRDGAVDLSDFLVLREVFLTSRTAIAAATNGGVANVPEPSSLLLWSPLLAIGCRFRRRRSHRRGQRLQQTIA